MHRITPGVIALLLACGGDAAPRDSTSTVTDSAGVRLVHNGSRAGADEPALPRLDLRIGVVEGDPDYQFTRISAIALGSSGEIFVVDAGSADLRAYDREGRFLWRCGRSGAGPGEFQNPYNVFPAGDTLFAAESRRVTALGPGCEVLETWTLRAAEGHLFAPLGRAPDGLWVANAMRRPDPIRFDPALVGKIVRDTVWLVVASHLAGASETLAAAAGPDDAFPTSFPIPSGRRVMVQGALGPASDERAFLMYVAPLFEPSPKGVLDGLGRVHLTSAGTYSIRTYDLDGRLVRRMTREHSPVQVTEALTDAYRDLVARYWDTVSAAPPGRLQSDEARPDLPHVDVIPPIGRLLPGEDGSLWVERPDLIEDPLELVWSRPPPPPRPTLWDRFDPDGVFLGQVVLDARFTPEVLGQNWVMGVLRDELGVQYVARLRIEG